MVNISEIITVVCICTTINYHSCSLAVFKDVLVRSLLRVPFVVLPLSEKLAIRLIEIKSDKYMQVSQICICKLDKYVQDR